MLDLEALCRDGVEILVLDTAAFIARAQLALYARNAVTTPSVVEEVRDRESVEGLEIALELGRVQVVEPSRSYVARVAEEARRVGSLHKLSKTDLDVAALALELAERGCRPIVLTDDYTLQNLLKHMGIEFRPVKTVGIAEARKFVARCPSCKRVIDPSAKTCPYCGASIRERS